jgi:hypothetical protein
MYPTAREQLARPTVSHASQHRHIHLAEFSAAERAEAARRGRRSPLAMPRLHLRARRWATHS